MTSRTRITFARIIPGGASLDKFPEDDTQLTPPHGDELRQEGGENSAVESAETVRGGTAETAGRNGDTIVQDHITQGQPLDGEEGDDVDRRAP